MSRGKFHGELSSKSSNDPLIIRLEIGGQLFHGQNKGQKEYETFRWAKNLNEKTNTICILLGCSGSDISGPSLK